MNTGVLPLGGVEYQSGKGAYTDPEDLPIRERCIISQSDAGGPVMLNAIYNNNYSFFVTPGYFVIDLEMNHDLRIAPTETMISLRLGWPVMIPSIPSKQPPRIRTRSPSAGKGVVS